MKAKPSKMKPPPKVAASAKVAPKKPVAAKPAKVVKPAIAKTAEAKPKGVPKPAAKTAPKSAAKTAGKPAAKVAGKAGATPPVRVVPKFGKLMAGLNKGGKTAAKDAEAPRPRVRPAPRPASVATRRKEHQHFRELLLGKRAELMNAYMISKGDSQSDLDNGTEDYVDYAVNSYAREFLLSLTELDRKQLLLVEDALARIDRGEYGYCQQCGEDIAPKRLEVQPWARHCVRCQELEEKGLLPQHTFAAADEEDAADEPEEPAAAEEEFESETEVDDEILDDEPLVVDGEDSED